LIVKEDGMKIVRLKSGREKSLQRRHPWIFSGAIATVEGNPQAGETVRVLSASGQDLAVGSYSPQSQIRVRIWSFDPTQSITSQFFQEQIDRALTARTRFLNQPNLTAYRLIHAESDGLPGVIVDRYGDYLVCQFLSAGAEYYKGEIVEGLVARFPNCGIYERSDVDVRQKEGLPLITGSLVDPMPPDRIEIQEYDCRFWVDVYQGHKTGFYLDQRQNRRLAATYADQRQVLNCFAYTGGFAVWALRGGASRVTNIDASATALELAEKTIHLNHLDPGRVEYRVGDVFQELRQYRDRGRRFDLIILDPPKFADSQHQLERAARGYKDINLLAFKLLNSAGILMTFSCSGLVSADLFQKIVAGAALDADCDARILQRMTQSADHPVALNFPEGEYLKGLVCQKI
jgi:23S rRNA (cytosine1962-C5)-methyltransferase